MALFDRSSIRLSADRMTYSSISRDVDDPGQDPDSTQTCPETAWVHLAAVVPVTVRSRSRPVLSNDPKPTLPESNVVSLAVISGVGELSM